MTIIEWLEATNTTQTELAKKLGVSDSWISQVKNGKGTLSPELAGELIELSGGEITYNDLYKKSA